MKSSQKRTFELHFPGSLLAGNHPHGGMHPGYVDDRLVRPVSARNTQFQVPAVVQKGRDGFQLKLGHLKYCFCLVSCLLELALYTQ